MMVLCGFVAWRVDFLATCGIRPVALVLVGAIFQVVIFFCDLIRLGERRRAMDIAMIGYWVAVATSLILFLFAITGSLQEKVVP